MALTEGPPLAPEELERADLQAGSVLALEITRREAASTHSVQEHLTHLRVQLFALQRGEEEAEQTATGTEGDASDEITPQAQQVAHALLKLHIEETEVSLSGPEAKPIDVEDIRARVRKGIGIAAQAA